MIWTDNRSAVDQAIECLIGKIMSGTITTSEREHYDELVELRSKMLTSPAWARWKRARQTRHYA